MKDKIILLVEDNADDVQLTLRALKQNNITNKIVIAKDGVEALNYLFCTGTFAGRDPVILPQVVLINLRLPSVGGLEVLRRICAEQRTRFLPVVILTSSKKEQNLINSYSLGANSYIRKPVDFTRFTEAVRNLRLYWLLLNEVPSLQVRV